MTKTARGGKPGQEATGPVKAAVTPLPRPLKRSGDAFKDLVELMARLRTPADGCPWDLEQTFATIAPYTIEEAYEVADAIERNDLTDLKGELGDLLFQSIFHARMAEELGAFSIDDVVQGVVDKMVRRHPHVFDTGAVETAAGQSLTWEAMKAEERSANTVADRSSALDGVAMALPALMRAEKLAGRAARVGFDWPSPEPVFDKLNEEVGELREALDAPRRDPTHIEEELGDILFVVANLCRKLGVDPEVALRGANSKFARRFNGMEALAQARGVKFGTLSLEQQELLWVEVKAAERAK